MSDQSIFFCPVCHAKLKRDAQDFPFCCERCRLIDLGNWSSESYRIPGAPAPLPDDEQMLH